MVGAFHGVAEREVELVLPGRHLVVARLDRDAQVVECADDLLADIAGDVDRVVEVAGPVVAPGAHAATGRVGVQEEELQLRRDRVVEAEGGSLRQHTRQHAARVAGEALTVRRQQIADHLGAEHAVCLADGQGLEVGTKEHVALEDPGETLDRRAVEPLAVANGVG